MDWFKKLFSNKDINTDHYQNAIREIRDQFEQHPKKMNEFAVFKEELKSNNHMLYFSPTNDPVFTTIISDFEAEKCDKPNLNNAKLFLGRFI